MMHESAIPPVWVSKRDGRLVPFEPDKISRALFAATESLGRPDPFLARELTDGVLHFLAAEAEHAPLSTAQVADLVTKVVRELGQPALAQSFAQFARQRPPREKRPVESAAAAAPALPQNIPDPQTRAWQTSGSCWREFALHEMFGRDLVAAHHQGLLLLGGLDAPLEPAASVLGPRMTGGLMEQMIQARTLTGGVLAVDGPEYEIASMANSLDVAAYARELRLGLPATGLRAVVNLNSGSPPSWAATLAEGPLFTGRSSRPEPAALAPLAAQLCEEVRTGPGADRIRIDWHLSERDFSGPTSLLHTLARRTLEGRAVAFTFDRPRRPIALAEGLDRSHPAVLMVVGVGLPRLAQQLGGALTPDRFLEKLPSLAHLALSAGVQKRDFLRRSRADWPAFLLSQARLLVVPLGLNSLVQNFLGHGMAISGSSAELAQRIVQTLVEALHRAGAAYRLDATVDSPLDGQFHFEACDWPPREPNPPGLTCGDSAAAPRAQLKAAGLLHATANAGTAHVVLPTEARPGTDDLVKLLEYAWRHTALVRLRFVDHAQTSKQLVAPWEEWPAL